MAKSKKQILIIDEELQNARWRYLCVFGICSTLSRHRLVYFIGNEFDLNFSINTKEKPTHTEKPKKEVLLQEGQLLLWGDEDATLSLNQLTCYECFDESTEMMHYIYHNRNKYPASLALVKEFPHIDYWWLIQGVLSDRDLSIQLIKQKMNNIDQIQLCIVLDPKQISTIPLFIAHADEVL